MQKQLKYNLKCPESDRQLGELYLVCDTIKKGLHKKEFEIYENLLNKLHQFTAMQVNMFNNEINNFKSNDSDNDSDNENNYDEDLKNKSKGNYEEDKGDKGDKGDKEDYDEDSVSEYDTDSEDEDYIITKSLIVIHDDICSQKILDLKNYSLFEFE